MDVNLMELLGKEFDGKVGDELSGMLGEPENKVKEAIGGLGPVLIAALADKTSSAQGLTDVFNMLKSSDFGGGQTLNLGSLVGSEGGSGFQDLMSAGGPLVVSLLGDHRGGVTEWLASLAGIEPKSAASLLSLAAPLLLNLIGGQAKQGGEFNQGALGQLLGSQSAFLADKVPEGLVSALGIGEISRLGQGLPLSAPQTLRQPKEAAPQTLRQPQEAVPQTLRQPKEAAPQTLRQPQEAAPQTLRQPQEAAPQTLRQPQEAAPQTLRQPQEAAPQTLRQPKEAAPRAVSEPKAGSGTSSWLWIILALIVIALVLWFLFGRG